MRCAPVTPDERERMAILCERIATEQDRQKFTQLVDELNELLDHKDERLRLKQSSPSLGPEPKT